MSEQQPTPACTECSGNGGHTIDTSSNGITRQHWQTCTGCDGTGIASGGQR